MMEVLPLSLRRGYFCMKTISPAPDRGGVVTMEINISQLYYEIARWRSLLEHYRVENTILKNRLAAALDKNMNENKLASAEYFQNEFLRKDEIINILKHDIRLQEKKLTDRFSADNAFSGKETIAAQDSLRDHICFLEKEFTRLREEFQHYVLSMQRTG